LGINRFVCLARLLPFSGRAVNADATACILRLKRLLGGIEYE
jgi:hypothetical protein